MTEIIECEDCKKQFDRVENDNICPHCGVYYIGHLDMEHQLYLSDWYDGGDVGF